MPIPSTGTFSDATVRAEWTNLALPMTSAQLGSAAGLGAAYSSEDLRGLSSRTVSLSGWLTTQGNKFYWEQGTITLNVSDGSPATNTSWNIISDTLGQAYIWGTSTATTCTVRGPNHGLDAMTSGSCTLECVTTIAGTVYVRTIELYYDADNLA